jgi:hypothetical protein
MYYKTGVGPGVPDFTTPEDGKLWEESITTLAASSDGNIFLPFESDVSPYPHSNSGNSGTLPAADKKKNEQDAITPVVRTGCCVSPMFYGFNTTSFRMPVVFVCRKDGKARINTEDGRRPIVFYASPFTIEKRD